MTKKWQAQRNVLQFGENEAVRCENAFIIYLHSVTLFYIYTRLENRYDPTIAYRFYPDLLACLREH